MSNNETTGNKKTLVEQYVRVRLYDNGKSSRYLIPALLCQILRDLLLSVICLTYRIGHYLGRWLLKSYSILQPSATEKTSRLGHASSYSRRYDKYHQSNAYDRSALPIVRDSLMEKTPTANNRPMHRIVVLVLHHATCHERPLGELCASQQPI